MAKKSKSLSGISFFGFTPSKPIPSGSACVVGGSIEACVLTTDIGDSFMATLYDSDPRTGGSAISANQLDPTGTTGSFCGWLEVGSAPGSTRWIVWEDASIGATSAQSGQITLVNCSFFARKFNLAEPLPQALVLSFKPIVADSDLISRQLNQPTRLTYSQDRDFGPCWYSQAMDLGGKSNLAFWLLRRSAVGTLDLFLRHERGDLAVFQLQIKPRVKLGFPIDVRFRKVAGLRFQKFKTWPRSITISPA